MSRHDDRVILLDLRDHMQEAVRFGEGKSATEIADDRMLSLALTQLLIWISRGAERVSETTRLRFPDIPWQELHAIHSRVSPDRIETDNTAVEQVIREELPPVIGQLETVLANCEWAIHRQLDTNQTDQIPG